MRSFLILLLIVCVTAVRLEKLHYDIKDKHHGKSSSKFRYSQNGFVLSTSGGGNRAAIGTVTALDWIKEHFDFGNVEEVAGLSGGSWGDTLYVLDHKKPWLQQEAEKSKTKKWGELEDFSRLTFNPMVQYQAWKADVARSLDPSDNPTLEVPWWKDSDKPSMWKYAKETFGHRAKMCSYVSNGKVTGRSAATAKSAATNNCKLCTDSHNMQCWSTRDGSRTNIDWRGKKTIVNDGSVTGRDMWLRKIPDVELPIWTALDQETITSSAWAASTDAVPIKTGDRTMYMFDAGIDCNLPFDPEWINNHEAVFFVDLSADKQVRQSFTSCRALWKSRHNVELTEEANIGDSKKGFGIFTVAGKDVKIIYISDFPDINEKYPTLSKTAWPLAFSKDSIRDIAEKLGADLQGWQGHFQGHLNSQIEIIKKFLGF